MVVLAVPGGPNNNTCSLENKANKSVSIISSHFIKLVLSYLLISGRALITSLESFSASFHLSFVVPGYGL